MRRALVLLAMVLACAGARAQDRASALGRAIEIEDPGGTLVPRVQAALRRAARGAGIARLSFWGASHTASDQYTGLLRERLQRRFGDAGQGVVMPAIPFPLYARRDIAIENGPGWSTLVVRGRERRPDRYGRMGFAIETRGATHGRVRIAEPSSVRRIEVWAHSTIGGGTIDLALEGRTIGSLPTAGESEGPIYLEREVPGARRIDVRTRGDGPVRIFGLSLERDQPGVIVESFGVPGSRARDQLPWDESILREHLARRMPDLVGLAYGTNETGDRTSMPILERDLREVIARWRRIAPEAAILLIGPSDWARQRSGRYEPRERTGQVRDLYRRVAFTSGCGFFDLVAFQGGVGSIPSWVAAGLALGDHVHMSDEGHERLAAVLERALLRGYE